MSGLTGAAERAALLRRQRAELVAGVADGTLPLGDLVASGRADLVKVVVLAEAVPGVGKVRSRRLLDALGVVPTARWGDLVPDAARRVSDALEEAGAQTA
jgi:hypothetical protein